MVSLSAHEALSGISGSISLAAWIFVLVSCNIDGHCNIITKIVLQVPQLIENYRSSSAEGISLAFLTVWFIGDLANFFGSIWAGLVPTVIALAVYFCIADAVLITQCLYYHYVNSRKQKSLEFTGEHEDDPSQPLLARTSDDIGLPGSRRRSSASQKRRNSSLVASTLPTIPEENGRFRPWIMNCLSVFAVCAIGAVGWAISWKAGLWRPTLESDDLDQGQTKVGAEVLGYLSAILYLGYVTYNLNFPGHRAHYFPRRARVPQIVKNFRERSCEGKCFSSWTSDNGQ